MIITLIQYMSWGMKVTARSIYSAQCLYQFCVPVLTALKPELQQLPTAIAATYLQPLQFMLQQCRCIQEKVNTGITCKLAYVPNVHTLCLCGCTPVFYVSSAKHTMPCSHPVMADACMHTKEYAD